MMREGFRRRGVLLVLCAPSGTGKSTLVKALRERYPSISFSVSYTTRKRREGERDGFHYHFIEREDFIQRREAGFFAEWAEVHGNLYGSPKDALERALREGIDILFDIDVQGAKQLKESFPCGSFVFVFPPSLDALRLRLEGRGTETEESMSRRLSAAYTEIEEASFFDAWIINDRLELAFEQLCIVYEAAKLSPNCYPHLVEKLLK